MNDIKLETKIGDIILDSCIYNASGPKCSEYNNLNNLLLSDSAAILSKSCTINQRDGNEGKRYWDSASYSGENNIISVNSMGLPNNGYLYYINYIDKLYELINNQDEDNFYLREKIKKKPYIISVAGLTLEDNIEIISAINKKNRDTSKIIKIGVELNLSCPNVIGKGQLAYDFEQLEIYLNKIFELDLKSIDIFGIKLPPYFELNHFELVSNIIKKFPIDFITCINSIPNTLYIDSNTDMPVIEPKNGLGGLGGNIIKPISLSNVFNFKKLLPNIDIIGCGGIINGQDVYEHILCGASAVQLGTIYMIEDVNSFSRIMDELNEIIKSKKYKTINDFKFKILKNTN